MSRLTSARAGVPSLRDKSKFRGFRRMHWMGTAAMFAKADGIRPVSRTWREGEPALPASMRK